MAKEGTALKTNNQKLQRIVIEKENELLKCQEVVTDLQSQLSKLNQEHALQKSKLTALQSFTSQLQQKYDKLAETETQKTNALNELLKSDLTQKVIEYKGVITELRNVLNQKEKERQVYV